MCRHIRKEITLYTLVTIAWLSTICAATPDQQSLPSLDSYEEWRWTSFTSESGLPRDRAEGIYEAADDIPWVVTSSALCWYDGFRWNTVRDSAGLQPHHISWITADSRSGVLFISENQVFRATAAGITRLTLFDQIKNVPLPQDPLAAIVPLGDSGYMVATNVGIYLVSNGKLLQLDLPGKLNPYTTSLFALNNGIWISTSQGLYSWNGSGWILRLEGQYEVVKLIAGHQGEALAWIRSPFKARGLWEIFNGSKYGHDTRQGNEFIQTMDVSTSGEVLSIYESGVVRLREGRTWKTVEAAPAQLRNSLVVKFRRNGDFWVATESGLNLYRRSSKRWSYWKHPFPNFKNTVHSIIQTHDSLLWFGTGKGIEIRTLDGKTIREIDQIDGRELAVVTGLCEDAEGNVWISSGSEINGAYRWDGKHWKHFGEAEGLLASRIHRITRDRSGGLWCLGLGTRFEGLDQPGAFLWRGGKFVQWGEAQGLPNGRVYSLVQTKDSSLWFGTLKGLHRWHNGAWTTLPELRTAKIFALAADSSDNIWFGQNFPADSTSFGCISNKGVVRWIPVTDRRISGDIWDLAVDGQGSVWIATRNAGVLSYRDGIWSSFNLSMGLNSLKLWPLLLANSHLYVGTDGSGVDVLDFSEVRDPLTQVEIDAPSINDNGVTVRWHTFPYWGGIPLSQIYSRYALDGGAWSDWADTREIRLPDVSTGQHTIAVQTKGLFGRYDVAGKRTSFVIALPLYLRPIAAIPMGILAISVSYLGLMLFVRKRRHAEELARNEEKLQMITDSTASAIFIFRNLMLIFVNPSAEALLGRPCASAVGCSFLELVDIQDQHLLPQFDGSSHPRSEEMSSRMELRIASNSREAKWIDFTWKRITYEGEPAILGTAIDITERKQAEEKLMAYQQQLKTLATELSMTEERERRRMATYLHDSVCQSLAFCQTKLTTLKLFPEGNSEMEALAEVNALLDEALENLQSLTFQLSPPVLYELSFEEALEWLTEQMRDQHGLRVSFSSDSHPKPISDDLRVTLFHGIRELLVNIVKHAGTDSAALSITRHEGSMKIVIEDYGRGFDPAANGVHTRRSTGFGLFNVRERLNSLGCSLEVHSKIGVGTRVVISTPLIG